MSAVATERVHHCGRLQDLPLVTYEIEMLGHDDYGLLRDWVPVGQHTTPTKGLLTVLAEYWAEVEAGDTYPPFVGEYRITAPGAGSATAFYPPEGQR